MRRPRTLHDVEILLLAHLRWLLVGGLLTGGLPLLAGLLGCVNLLVLVAIRRRRPGSERQAILGLLMDAGALGLALAGGGTSPYMLALPAYAALAAWIPSRVVPAGAMLAYVLAWCVPLGPTAGAIATLMWGLARGVRRHHRAVLAEVEELRLNQARLDQLRAVGAVAAGFAHELATPLNTVRLRLERLERGMDLAGWEELAPALEALEQSEQSLRAFAVARGEPTALSFQELPVQRVLDEVVGSWQASHPEVPVTWQARLGLEVHARLPAIAFARNLLAILDNARAAGTAITLAATATPAALEIRVRDDGPGFPATVLAGFGEPFVSARPGGTGLGLYNLALLASALGGRAAIANHPDGAEVRWWLPRTAG